MVNQVKWVYEEVKVTLGASNAQWPLGIVSGQRLDVELSDFTLPVIQTDEKLNPLSSIAIEWL